MFLSFFQAGNRSVLESATIYDYIVFLDSGAVGY